MARPLQSAKGRQKMLENTQKCTGFAQENHKKAPFLPENARVLPPVAQTLIEALGFDTACLVIEQLGGACWRVSYADNSKERQAIEARIGYHAWLKLQNAFAGETLYIPKCHKALLAVRNQEIKTTLKQCADGVTPKTEKIRELVKQFKLSDRRIAQIASEIKPDSPQAGLF